MSAFSSCRIALRAGLAAFAVWLSLFPYAASWAAPPAASYEGKWAFQVGGRNLLVLTFAAGSGPLVGSLTRPTHFSLNGQMVSGVRLPLIRETVTRERLSDTGVEFTVQDTSDPKNTDDFVFRPTGADTGELRFALAPSAPLMMLRATANAQVATDWDPETTYSPEDIHVSSPEMARLFKEDQADRQSVGHIDWDKVSKADAERRHAVALLLKADDLHTGTDFLGAAFIFQHGDTADDYLLAHVLAMVAMRKGRTDADWIAAATLDRYLQRTGKPQIFGTQFSLDRSRLTQEPLDRDLISDVLRADMNVPPLASQTPPPSK